MFDSIKRTSPSWSAPSSCDSGRARWTPWAAPRGVGTLGMVRLAGSRGSFCHLFLAKLATPSKRESFTRGSIIFPPKVAKKDPPGFFQDSDPRLVRRDFSLCKAHGPTCAKPTGARAHGHGPKGAPLVCGFKGKLRGSHHFGGGERGGILKITAVLDEARKSMPRKTSPQGSSKQAVPKDLENPQPPPKLLGCPPNYPQRPNLGLYPANLPPPPPPPPPPPHSFVPSNYPAPIRLYPSNLPPTIRLYPQTTPKASWLPPNLPTQPPTYQPPTYQPPTYQPPTLVCTPQTPSHSKKQKTKIRDPLRPGSTPPATRSPGSPRAPCSGEALGGRRWGGEGGGSSRCAFKANQKTAYPRQKEKDLKTNRQRYPQKKKN